jgi:hypothetical protein
MAAATANAGITIYQSFPIRLICDELGYVRSYVYVLLSWLGETNNWYRGNLNLVMHDLLFKVISCLTSVVLDVLSDVQI